jgi:hypothetical protein
MQNNSASLNEVYQFCSVSLFRPRPQPGPHLHSMCTAREIFSIVRGQTIGHSSIRTPTNHGFGICEFSTRSTLGVVSLLRTPVYW